MVKYFNRILVSLNSLAAIAIVIMIISTVIDVTGRRLFRQPLQGTVELNQLLLVVVAFIALGYCQLKKGHVRVELVLNRLPSIPKRVVDIIETIFILVIMGFITQGAVVMAYEATVAREAVTGLINFPMWPGRIALALGFAMLCLQLVVQIVTDFRSLVVKQPSQQSPGNNVASPLK